MIPEPLATAISCFGWSWLFGLLLYAVLWFRRSGAFRALGGTRPELRGVRWAGPDPDLLAGVERHVGQLSPSALDEHFRPSPRTRQRNRQPGSRCRVCARPRAQGDHTNCR